MKHRILAIDDSALDLSALQFLLSSKGFSLHITEDVDHGIAYVRQNKGALSLAIVDYDMPGSNGMKITKDLKQIDPGLQIIIYSGDKRSDAYDPLTVGAEYFIQKGSPPEKILAVVNMFCAKYETAHRRAISPGPVTKEELRAIAEVGMIGCSHQLAEVAKLIRAYAPLEETVLITGENGTGKERVARAIHEMSGARGPFIPVNCGAIPHELLESELFGHEKGAFSGAIKDKLGLAQAAMNGTLFLDEIGDLPLQLQVKLLRFLQEGEVRPVGSNNTLKIRTRVIVATNVDLENAVTTKDFRQDLFYRIKGFQIHIPALRERKEDIRPLVLHFSEKVAAEKGLVRGFLEETVKMLTRHEWPGNVRELEHEVKRAMLLAKNTTVTPSDIAEKIRASIEETNKKSYAGLNLDYEAFRERQRRRDEEEERHFLLENVSRAKSIRELARDFLKVSNSTLQGRLKALSIEFKPNNRNE